MVRTEALYRERYDGWNVKHFYSFYRHEHAGMRSYTWVKNTLQRAGLVAKAPARGRHRRRRECAPVPGMMLNQDGSTHQWVPGQLWDLIITLDDATSEHYSMFFVEQEDTASSLQGMAEVIRTRGLPSSLYTDRGSHYWLTPEAGGKVDRTRPTQFGRAMRQLGVEMIPAYSPEARGRCERMFATHQERLPKELAARGIDTMQHANRYLAGHYRAAFNEEFAVPAAETGSAFVPFIGSGLADALCEHHERTVARHNCVSFQASGSSSPPRPTAATSSRPGCGCIVTPTGAWRYSTGHAGSPTTNPMGPWWQTPTAPGRTGACEWAGLAERRGGPVDLWTSPADRREPRGPCGQDRGQRGRVAHRLAHTLAPLAHKLPRNNHNRSRKNGQPLCYKTGQFYLLPTLHERQAGNTRQRGQSFRMAGRGRGNRRSRDNPPFEADRQAAKRKATGFAPSSSWQKKRRLLRVRRMPPDPFRHGTGEPFATIVEN